MDAGDVTDHDAALRLRQELVEREVPGIDEEVRRPDARRRAVAAALPVPGRALAVAGPMRGVRVVEEAVQRARREQFGPAARDTFAVERARPRAVESPSVVDQRERGRADGLPDHAREQRTALQHVLGVQGAREHAEEARRRERVEDDGHLRRRRLRGAEHRDRTVDRLVRNGRPVECVQPAGDRVRESRLRLVTLDREGDDDGVRIGPRELDVDAGRRRDRDPRDRVADLREVDLRDAGIARDRVALQVEGHAHLVVGAHGGALLPIDLGHRGERLGRRQHVVLVGLGERGVVPRSPDRLLGLVRRRVGRPRVAEAAVADHADAEPA